MRTNEVARWPHIVGSNAALVFLYKSSFGPRSNLSLRPLAYNDAFSSVPAEFLSYVHSSSVTTTSAISLLRLQRHIFWVLAEYFVSL